MPRTGALPPTPDLPEAESVEQALAWMLRTIRRLPAEVVPLAEARGRVLAGDVRASTDVWPCPRAAMDGYAVRSVDVSSALPVRPVVLRITKPEATGFLPDSPVTSGTAVRVPTGAPLPDGADAVIPFEEVQADGDRLTVARPVPPGKHVFPPGQDARSGEVVIPAGTLLRGGNLGLLAALGVTSVEVVRRARVAVLAVGDELVDASETPLPGQVRDSNSFALGAEIEALGGDVRRLGIAPDDPASLAACIEDGLRGDAFIVCAGMSVGERDLVKEALVAAGVRLLFWRVKMKPGHPAAFGQAGDVAVFGLPGSPGAAMAAFEELVRPALRALMGYRRRDDLWHPATLRAPITVKPGRRRYFWARAAAGESGLVVEALPNQHTSSLRSQSDANAIIRIEPDATHLAIGERVRIRLRGDLEGAAPLPPATTDRPASQAIPVLAVIGAKDAGKTALIERLVPELTHRGYRVGVIKHDTHGFEMDREGTDTWRAGAAGAEAVAIAGPDKTAVIIHSAGEMPLADVQAHLRDVDLILLEGYSREPVPKIEVRRAGTNADKPQAAGPCIATVTVKEGGGGTVTFEDIPALVDCIERALTFS